MTGLVAVTGASGFIGRHLVPLLRDRGHPVRAIVRSSAPPAGATDVRRADLLDPASLSPALEGVHTAYYLVHSMERASGRGFAERDREAAENFARAARAAGVSRIIYLGGLGETGPDLSEHLRSRAEVGRILASAGVPATVLRAAIILGPGGASWDMLRQLVERLPVMVTPRWVDVRCQPIALRDALGYLSGAAEVEAMAGEAYDIGGPDVLTYREMMLELAAILGKRRFIVGVPVLTPRLSSYWVDLVTDVSSAVARPLIDGLKNEVVCREDRIRNLVRIPLTPYRDAVRLAVEGRV